MDLAQYTLLSVSVAATLISLVLILGLLVSFQIYARLMRIFDQLEAMSHAGLEASQSLKGFVERTTEQVTHMIQTFTTIQGAKEVASFIGDTISKARQKKETKGQKT